MSGGGLTTTKRAPIVLYIGVAYCLGMPRDAPREAREL